MLTFRQGSSQGEKLCEDVDIAIDNVLEGNELFFIVLVNIFHDRSLEIDLSRILKRVEIHDSKNKFTSLWCKRAI